MARIAIGGFQHETNTFSSTPASLADFETPDAWPGLTRGGAMLEAVAGINLPMLVKLAKVRADCPLPEAVVAAQEAGRKYVTIASRVLAGK